MIEEMPAPITTWGVVCLFALTLAHPIIGIRGISRSIQGPRSTLNVMTIKVIQLACRLIFQYRVITVKIDVDIILNTNIVLRKNGASSRYNTVKPVI